MNRSLSLIWLHRGRANPEQNRRATGISPWAGHCQAYTLCCPDSICSALSMGHLDSLGIFLLLLAICVSRKHPINSFQTKVQRCQKFHCPFGDTDSIQPNEPPAVEYEQQPGRWLTSTSAFLIYSVNMHRAPSQCHIVEVYITWLRHGHCPRGPPSPVRYSWVKINHSKHS